MPVDYSNIDAIAVAVADVYAEAEHALIALLTRQLSAGQFDENVQSWAARKLGEARALRRTAALLVDELQRDGNMTVRQAVADGFRSGQHTALTDLTEQHIGDIGPAARVAAQPAGAAVQVLADAVVEELRPVHAAVLRCTDDVYRKAVAGAVARRLAGARDTRRAAQDAWAALARQGVTGFTDRTGRRWRLSTYVEMATRTGVARAALHGEVDVMTAAGIGMCYVVDNPRECPICAKWESKVLALSAPPHPPAAATLDEAMAEGLFHPNCFPGEVLVSAPTGVRAADSRWYDGELVVVHTASGQELPVTPNHPVLTPEGWVAAGALKVGQHVMRYRGGSERMDGVGPGDESIPARIGEVFEALAQASPVPPVRVPASAEQFHGDGGDTHVEVVFADGLLTDGVFAEIGECVHDVPLVVGGAGLRSLLAGRAPREVIGGAFGAAHGGVRGLRQGGALCRAHAGLSATHRLPGIDAAAVVADYLADGAGRDPEPIGYLGLSEVSGRVQLDGFSGPAASPAPLAWHTGGVQSRKYDLASDAERRRQIVGRLASTVPTGDFVDLGLIELGPMPPTTRHASGIESGRDGGAGDAEGGCELALRLAGAVATDQIRKVERRPFAGHVYNLQTSDGWYTAAGIVVHNCRHEIRPWQPGVRIVGARNPDPAGYDAEQQQRAIERRLRGWRERYAAAFDEQGRQYAAKRIAAWSQRLADHLDEHPRLPRKSYREHPGAGFRAPKSARTRHDAAHLAGRA